MSVLSLAIVKKGDGEIAGLTDKSESRRLGPKRANKIRTLFNLGKEDDVRKYVIRRTFEKKGKKVVKTPKIQRLITPQRIQRKRHEISLKRARGEKTRELKSDYAKLLAVRQKEQREARNALHNKRRLSSARKSESKA